MIAERVAYGAVLLTLCIRRRSQEVQGDRNTVSYTGRLHGVLRQTRNPISAGYSPRRSEVAVDGQRARRTRRPRRCTVGLADGSNNCERLCFGSTSGGKEEGD